MTEQPVRPWLELDPSAPSWNPYKKLSNRQLLWEFYRMAHLWDTLEFEGGGSPRESLAERLMDIETVLEQRGYRYSGDAWV